MMDRRMERLRQSKQDWKDTAESNHKLAYERKVSRRLLHALGMSTMQVKALFNPSKFDPDEYMTFTWLSEHLSIPVRFVSGGLIQLRIRDMLKPAVRTNALMKAWAEQVEPLSDNFHQIAMVFSTPETYDVGDMVLHNYPVLPTDRDTALVYIPGVNLLLERLPDFMLFLAGKYGDMGGE